MNRKRLLFACALLVPGAFVYACGGSGGVDLDAGTDGGGNDGTVGPDTNPGNDSSTGNDSSADTGTSTDGGGDTGAGADTGTGTDSGAKDSGIGDAGKGDGAVQCTKPSDCTNEFCCGTLVFNGGTPPANCNVQSLSSTCTATCASSITISFTTCSETDTIRACAAKNDCLDAGTGYTSCCTVPHGDASAEFCWDSNYVGVVQGMTCL